MRLFGVNNYPERGTKDDPEIDGDQLSSWAKTGYPQVAGSEAGKEANYRLGDDFVNERGERVSDVYVSKLKKVALARFERVLNKLRKLYESKVYFNQALSEALEAPDNDEDH